MLQLGGLEPERAAAALVGDLAAAVDQVEPAGHPAVAGADGVVDRVDQHREAEVERLAAGPGDPDPLVVGPGLAERDADPVVALHLPAVGRVGLADVDHHERGPVLVAPVELLDVPGLAAERPAGEVAEDQHHRLRADELRERDLVLAVDRLEGEVGRGLVRASGPGWSEPISWRNRPLSSVQPRRAAEAARRPAASRAGGGSKACLEVVQREEAEAVAVERPGRRPRTPRG